ncbi:Phosphatidylinositol 3-kinase tor2, related [Neospora caninum Liverpool]|uniref:non-specific serine/threonine protein kinase n=1 Tax=Neospora caninum (strain Liverpool) TaxID=572307 RepID=F0VP22_NEOCL|nr:Phosphatidylinositol 3-kinase tor2, related [Neospora caninum Liverpool]CBZ55468.1 Phosphatidylinositol 3-kinase tor2, related [Neospora caninum Liverpool]|eukprot:XP_003885496.1 Phosphatidylinositol 3-kinase tor2, related [Neospora caninum Liverpool]
MPRRGWQGTADGTPEPQPEVGTPWEKGPLWGAATNMRVGEANTVVPCEYLKELCSRSDRLREEAAHQIRIHLEVMARESKGGVGRVVEEVCALLWSLITSRQLTTQLGALELMCALLVGPFLYWENDKLQLPFLHLACETLRCAAVPAAQEVTGGAKEEDGCPEDSQQDSTVESNQRKLEPLITERQCLLAWKVAEAISLIAVSGNAGTASKAFRNLLRVSYVGWLRRGQPTLYQLTAVRIIGRLARCRPDAVPEDVRKELLECRIWEAIHHAHQPRLRKAGVDALRALLNSHGRLKEKSGARARLRRRRKSQVQGCFDALDAPPRVVRDTPESFQKSGPRSPDAGYHEDRPSGLGQFWKHLLKGLAARSAAFCAAGTHKEGAAPAAARTGGPAKEAHPLNIFSVAEHAEETQTQDEETALGGDSGSLHGCDTQRRLNHTTRVLEGCPCGSASWMSHSLRRRTRECENRGALVSSCPVCKAVALQQGSLLALAEVFEASKHNQAILAEVRQHSSDIIPLLQDLFFSFPTLVHPTRLALARIPPLLACVGDVWFLERGGLDVSISCVFSLLRDHPRVFVSERSASAWGGTAGAAPIERPHSETELADVPESSSLGGALNEQDTALRPSASAQKSQTSASRENHALESGSRVSGTEVGETTDGCSPADHTSSRQMPGASSEKPEAGPGGETGPPTLPTGEPAGKHMSPPQGERRGSSDSGAVRETGKELLEEISSSTQSRSAARGAGSVAKEPAPPGGFSPQASRDALASPGEGPNISPACGTCSAGTGGESADSRSRPCGTPATQTLNSGGSDRYNNGVAAITSQAAEACAAFNCVAELALQLPEAMETRVYQFIPAFLRAIELGLIGFPLPAGGDSPGDAGGVREKAACTEREFGDDPLHGERPPASQHERDSRSRFLAGDHRRSVCPDIEEEQPGSVSGQETSVSAGDGVPETAQLLTEDSSGEKTPQQLLLSASDSSVDVPESAPGIFSFLDDPLCQRCEQMQKERMDMAHKLVQHVALQCVSKLIRAFGGHMKGRLDFLIQSMFSGGINRSLLEALQHLVGCPHIHRAVQDLFVANVQAGLGSFRKASPSQKSSPYFDSHSQDMASTQLFFVRKGDAERHSDKSSINGDLGHLTSPTGDETTSRPLGLQANEHTGRPSVSVACARCGAHVAPATLGEEGGSFDPAGMQGTNAIETMLLAMQGAFWFGVDDFQVRLVVAECALQLTRHPQAPVRAAAVLTVCRLLLSPSKVFDDPTPGAQGHMRTRSETSGSMEAYAATTCEPDGRRRYPELYSSRKISLYSSHARDTGDTRRALRHGETDENVGAREARASEDVAWPSAGILEGARRHAGTVASEHTGDSVRSLVKSDGTRVPNSVLAQDLDNRSTHSACVADSTVPERPYETCRTKQGAVELPGGDASTAALVAEAGDLLGGAQFPGDRCDDREWHAELARVERTRVWWEQEQTPQMLFLQRQRILLMLHALFPQVSTDVSLEVRMAAVRALDEAGDVATPLMRHSVVLVESLLTFCLDEDIMVRRRAVKVLCRLSRLEQAILSVRGLTGLAVNYMSQIVLSSARRPFCREAVPHVAELLASLCVSARSLLAAFIRPAVELIVAHLRRAVLGDSDSQSASFPGGQVASRARTSFSVYYPMAQHLLHPGRGETSDAEDVHEKREPGEAVGGSHDLREVSGVTEGGCTDDRRPATALFVEKLSSLDDGDSSDDWGLRDLAREAAGDELGFSSPLGGDGAPCGGVTRFQQTRDRALSFSDGAVKKDGRKRCTDKCPSCGSSHRGHVQVLLETLEKFCAVADRQLLQEIFVQVLPMLQVVITRPSEDGQCSAGVSLLVALIRQTGNCTLTPDHRRILLRTFIRVLVPLLRQRERKLKLQVMRAVGTLGAIAPEIYNADDGAPTAHLVWHRGAATEGHEGAHPSTGPADSRAWREPGREGGMRVPSEEKTTGEQRTDGFRWTSLRQMDRSGLQEGSDPCTAETLAAASLVEAIYASHAIGGKNRPGTFSVFRPARRVTVDDPLVNDTFTSVDRLGGGASRGATTKEGTGLDDAEETCRGGLVHGRDVFWLTRRCLTVLTNVAHDPSLSHLHLTAFVAMARIVRSYLVQNPRMSSVSGVPMPAESLRHDMLYHVSNDVLPPSRGSVSQRGSWNQILGGETGAELASQALPSMLPQFLQTAASLLTASGLSGEQRLAILATLEQVPSLYKHTPCQTSLTFLDVLFDLLDQRLAELRVECQHLPHTRAKVPGSSGWPSDFAEQSKSERLSERRQGPRPEGHAPPRSPHTGPERVARSGSRPGLARRVDSHGFSSRTLSTVAQRKTLSAVPSRSPAAMRRGRAAGIAAAFSRRAWDVVRGKARETSPGRNRSEWRLSIIDCDPSSSDSYDSTSDSSLSGDGQDLDSISADEDPLDPSTEVLDEYGAVKGDWWPADTSSTAEREIWILLPLLEIFLTKLPGRITHYSSRAARQLQELLHIRRCCPHTALAERALQTLQRCALILRPTVGHQILFLAQLCTVPSMSPSSFLVSGEVAAPVTARIADLFCEDQDSAARRFDRWLLTEQKREQAGSLRCRCCCCSAAPLQLRLALLKTVETLLADCGFPLLLGGTMCRLMSILHCADDEGVPVELREQVLSVVETVRYLFPKEAGVYVRQLQKAIVASGKPYLTDGSFVGKQPSPPPPAPPSSIDLHATLQQGDSEASWGRDARGEPLPPEARSAPDSTGLRSTSVSADPRRTSEETRPRPSAQAAKTSIHIRGVPEASTPELRPARHSWSMSGSATQHQLGDSDPENSEVSLEGRLSEPGPFVQNPGRALLRHAGICRGDTLQGASWATTHPAVANLDTIREISETEKRLGDSEDDTFDSGQRVLDQALGDEHRRHHKREKPDARERRMTRRTRYQKKHATRRRSEGLHSRTGETAHELWTNCDFKNKAELHCWFRNVSLAMLKECRAPVVRACLPVALQDPSVTASLLSAVFLTYWASCCSKGALYQMYQVGRGLRGVLLCPDVTVPALRRVLGLIEMIEQQRWPLPVDTQLLAAVAEKCQANAKAIRYREELWLADPGGSVEALIRLSHGAQQLEAARGILAHAQKKLRLPVKECWYVQLGDWEQALEAYEQREREDPSNAEWLKGKMRCLRALGEWERLAVLADDLWQDDPSQFSPYGAGNYTSLRSGSDMSTVQLPSASASPRTSSFASASPSLFSPAATSAHAPVPGTQHPRGWQSFLGQVDKGESPYVGPAHNCRSSPLSDPVPGGSAHSPQERANDDRRAQDFQSQLAERRRETASLAASVAFHFRDWAALERYVQWFPATDSCEHAFYMAVLRVHRGDFEAALEEIQRARQLLDPELTALLGESYKRAYPALVTLQQLAELEEIVELLQRQRDRREEGQQLLGSECVDGNQSYAALRMHDFPASRNLSETETIRCRRQSDVSKGFLPPSSAGWGLRDSDLRGRPEDSAEQRQPLGRTEGWQQDQRSRGSSPPRYSVHEQDDIGEEGTSSEQLRHLWRTRLATCESDAEIWQKLLRVRSLIVSPHEDATTWLRFSSLCRQQQRARLSVEIIQCLRDHPHSRHDPRVALEAFKVLHAVGRKLEAQLLLTSFCCQFVTTFFNDMPEQLLCAQDSDVPLCVRAANLLEFRAVPPKVRGLRVAGLSTLSGFAQGFVDMNVSLPSLTPRSEQLLRATGHCELDTGALLALGRREVYRRFLSDVRKTVQRHQDLRRLLPPELVVVKLMEELEERSSPGAEGAKGPRPSREETVGGFARRQGSDPVWERLARGERLLKPTDEQPLPAVLFLDEPTSMWRREILRDGSWYLSLNLCNQAVHGGLQQWNLGSAAGLTKEEGLRLLSRSHLRLAQWTKDTYNAGQGAPFLLHDIHFHSRRKTGFASSSDGSRSATRSTPASRPGLPVHHGPAQIHASWACNADALFQVLHWQRRGVLFQSRNAKAWSAWALTNFQVAEALKIVATGSPPFSSSNNSSTVSSSTAHARGVRVSRRSEQADSPELGALPERRGSRDFAQDGRRDGESHQSAHFESSSSFASYTRSNSLVSFCYDGGSGGADDGHRRQLRGPGESQYADSAVLLQQPPLLPNALTDMYHAWEPFAADLPETDENGKAGKSRERSPHADQPRGKEEPSGDRAGERGKEADRGRAARHRGEDGRQTQQHRPGEKQDEARDVDFCSLHEADSSTGTPRGQPTGGVAAEERSEEEREALMLASMLPHFIVEAVRAFLRSIELRPSRSSLQDILRLIKLWFVHADIPVICPLVQHGVSTIPLATWLDVIPQLVGRLSTPDSCLRGSLMNLLSKAAVQFPQELIFPLAVASKSATPHLSSSACVLLNIMARDHRELVQHALLVSEEVVRVAALWEERWLRCLEQASEAHHTRNDFRKAVALLEPMHEELNRGPQTFRETLFLQKYGRELENAYTYLKRFKRSGNRYDVDQCWMFYLPVFTGLLKDSQNIKRLDLKEVSSALAEVKDLKVAVPGCTGVDGNYPLIRSFLGEVSVFTSKQRPRKIGIMGSDGRVWNFLLKGQDDLTQDERIMQALRLINHLMKSNADARRKELSIPLYSIVPLSPTAGLIGWLQNTETMLTLIKAFRQREGIPVNHEQLVLKSLYHKYESLTLLQKVDLFEQTSAATSAQALRRVLWLRARNSEEWLVHRANFCKSVAVMSMVGYVLGLGDRHPSNMLLMGETGRVAHIDFSDCFEVAAYRPRCPEKVPFRLTRMIVCALESGTVEGTFRATCEQVMTLLRTNQDAIVAMLEAAFVGDVSTARRLHQIFGWQSHRKVPPKPTVSGPSGSGFSWMEARPRYGHGERVFLQASLRPFEQQYRRGDNTRDLSAQGSSWKRLPRSDGEDAFDRNTSGLATPQEGGPTTAVGHRRGNVQRFEGGHPRGRGLGADDFLEQETGSEPSGDSTAPCGTGSVQRLQCYTKQVIARVEAKLTGYDFEEYMDVPAQVDRLIEEANGVENLCVAYAGWCPFW